jgi:hypothetical protein
LPGDRIAALRRFLDAGICNWVSPEPTIDCESGLDIVRERRDFVAPKTLAGRLPSKAVYISKAQDIWYIPGVDVDES